MGREMKVFYLGMLGIFSALAIGCEQPYGISVSGSTEQSTAGPGSGSASSGSTSSCPLTGQTTENLRILFMVDNSGSTKQTDPQQVNRVATVQSFLNTYGSQTNLTYAYDYFGASAMSYNMAPGGTFVASPATPFGNSANLASALSLFETLSTTNNTKYTLAFNMLQSQITSDQQATPGEGYVVIFMSDGEPTDLGSGASEASGITSLVNSLLSATGGVAKVTVSSVFFGPSTDTQSVTNLQTMATVGGGNFVNTNVTTAVQIVDLINVPGACGP
jgi:hypothetical protein